jgi:hypothetical protein
MSVTASRTSDLLTDGIKSYGKIMCHAIPCLFPPLKGINVYENEEENFTFFKD